jgi:hypothetical protein
MQSGGEKGQSTKQQRSLTNAVARRFCCVGSATREALSIVRFIVVGISFTGFCAGGALALYLLIEGYRSYFSAISMIGAMLIISFAGRNLAERIILGLSTLVLLGGAFAGAVFYVLVVEVFGPSVFPELVGWNDSLVVCSAFVIFSAVSTWLLFRCAVFKMAGSVQRAKSTELPLPKAGRI